MRVVTANSSVEILDDIKSTWDVVGELANRPDQEEPFYVVDIGDIVSKHKRWRLNLPRVEPFYAVKCNDTTAVLEVLAALGAGFDCASKGEIEKVLDLGVEPERIIYANPCKTSSFVKYAASKDVRMMTFDNEAELYKIKALFPDAQMVLRIRSDDVKAQCPLGIKFGILPENAPALLRKAMDLGVNVIGISFHVGSGCQDHQAYYNAIQAARWVFDVARDIGFVNMSFLDLGGGYPGQVNAALSFEATAKVICSALDEFFPEEMGVRIIAEPGRYYVASAFTLCVNVIAKREVVTADGDNHVMYYVNDGVYGSFNCLLYDHATVFCVPLKQPLSSGAAEVGRCSVWGPTCDGLDRILEDINLPELSVGQWLVFPDMGAYTVAAASTFNGFQKPPLHFVMKYGTWLYLKDLLPSLSMHAELPGSPLDSGMESSSPSDDPMSFCKSNCCDFIVGSSNSCDGMIEVSPFVAEFVDA